MNQNEEIYTKLPQNIPNDAKLFRTCRKTKYVSKPLLKLMASRGEARGLKNWRQKSFAACGYCSQMFARILPLFFSPSFAAFQKNKKKKEFPFSTVSVKSILRRQTLSARLERRFHF
jgi:hypothetical protein